MTVSGASSWMRIDHGGSISARSRNALAGPGPVEQAGDGVHAKR